ncbi:MAG: hypothetical protein ACI9YO_002856 [Gammaproteobacteria bacterium]|jgi:hypothetical protein
MVSFTMKNPTPLFPGFHLQTLRRKHRSASQKLLGEVMHLKQKSFGQLSPIYSKRTSQAKSIWPLEWSTNIQ